MNNTATINVIGKRAGIITCLFLLYAPLQLTARGWQFDPPTQQAYDLVLKLQFDEARQLIPDPKTAQENYVLSLAEAIELLISEDGEKYQDYHDAYEDRLGKRSKSSLAEDLFLQAELRLQWAFVYMKFGHEFDAAWNLRQAYLNVKDCKDKFPEFKEINKVSGILEIIIGSVPEKYNWVLNIMGMEGTISKGLEELDGIRKSNSPLHLETDLIYALIQCYVFQNTNEGVSIINDLLKQYPDNRLINFMGAALAIKNSQSEYALERLLKLERINEGMPITFAYYLKGEVYLHKADYQNSIAAYRWFINNYKGQNYMKDAYYKIGLCYWLNGNKNDALVIFKQAKTIGKEASEADKYAARSLADNELPNIPLSKARYYTDGGYYDQAQRVLDSIRSPEIPNLKDHIEYYYRKARLAHKQGKIDEAKKYYTETINNTAEDNMWYFAPNSCLQMGYLLLKENDKAAARNYFERAMTYEKHEYKNSIDSKAKSALAQLREDK